MATIPEPTTAAPGPPLAPNSIPTIRVPVDARGLSLTVLAVIAALCAMDLAQTFFVALLAGILVAYALNPLVAWFQRFRVPRVAATILVMTGVVAALGFGVYSLRGQMQTIIEQLPEAAKTLSGALAKLRIDHAGNMQKMQNAAAEVEKATTQAPSGPAKASATHVVIDQPGFKIGNFLMVGSMGALSLMGQVATVLLLAFFLLLGGSTFKLKMVRLTGPSLSRRKITVQILDDINNSIQKYLFMLLATNLLVAALAWIAFRWIGLENAGAWAVASGLLHVIPYLGPGVTAVAVGMAAFMQFESFSTAFVVSGASLAIATLSGTFVTTWMAGRIAKMNSAAVFISLMFWGWLWGVWGMFLSIPIVVIVKVVSEHVEQLKPVAEMLGE